MNIGQTILTDHLISRLPPGSVHEWSGMLGRGIDNMLVRLPNGHQVSVAFTSGNYSSVGRGTFVPGQGTEPTFKTACFDPDGEWIAPDGGSPGPSAVQAWQTVADIVATIGSVAAL